MFIEKMLKLMKEKHIRRNKISKDLNFGINQIKYWETHGNIPSGDTVKRIADYLGTTSEYLLSDSDDVPATGNNNVTCCLCGENMNDDERILLFAYKYLLNSQGQKKVAEYIDDLAGNTKFASEEKVFRLPTAAFDGKYSGEEVEYTAEELRILLSSKEIESDEF